jgi:hypothetical protein
MLLKDYHSAVAGSLYNALSPLVDDRLYKLSVQNYCRYLAPL